jgi:hypothetical protein
MNLLNLRKLFRDVEAISTTMFLIQKDIKKMATQLDVVTAAVQALEDSNAAYQKSVDQAVALMEEYVIVNPALAALAAKMTTDKTTVDTNKAVLDAEIAKLAGTATQ